MKLLTRVSGVASALTLAVFSFAVLGSSPAYAAGGTATWTDATGDHKFSTAGNWAENALPEAGDRLIINTLPTGLPDPYVVSNDITTAFASVETQGSPFATYVMLQFANDLNLADGAVYKVDEAKKVSISFANGKKMKAAGDLVVEKGWLPSTNTISYVTVVGALTAKDGVYFSGSELATGAAKVVIENGASIVCLAALPDYNVNTPITLGGGTGATPATLGFAGCMGSVGGGAAQARTLDLAEVTLASDALIAVHEQDVVKVHQLTANGHSLTRAEGADGTLILPTGTQSTTYEQKTTRLDGDKPTEDVTVYPNETTILNGNRCGVTVREGGTLKGIGTVCGLVSYGIVSPGNSPGKITVQNSFILSPTSKYIVEVASKESYDQVVAKDVYINDAQLELTFLDSAKVTAGDVYTIIDNTGEGVVQGGFKDLPEGATFSAMGGVFKISYVGGDGNDVTLTVQSVPTVPNTGGMLLKTNPALIATVSIVGAVILAGAARFASKRR